MKEVMVKVKIPEGYELAHEEVRKPKRGELFLGLSDNACIAEFDYSTNKYPILKKAWQPEKGKLYKFWKNESLGVHYGLFRGMTSDGDYFVSDDNISWDNCAPIDPEELGK
jgi:hypothetical protein